MNLTKMASRALRRVYARPPEPIPPEHRRLLLLVGAGTMIANFDVSLYGLAMHQIQASFAIPENEISTVNALFRLGVLPAILLAYLADVIGRRIMLLATLAGATLATLWTSVAQTTEEFVVAQLVARAFIYTEELVCVVVIAEEFHERVRGWGIGALAALGAFGSGLAAIAFGFVTLLPYGWRALYLLGAIPLVYLLWLRRSLPETGRFRAEKSAAHGVWRPMITLFRDYPGRMMLLILMAVPAAFAAANIITFLSKFLQSEHGWHPAQVSMLIVFGGLVGILGATSAGALSDRFGRRAVLSVAIVTFVICFAAFYGFASGLMLVPLWIVGIFAFLMCDALIGALSAELFPTSHRTLASSIRYLFWILAGSVSLYIEGTLYDRFGSHGLAVTVLLLPGPLALIPIWFLPEPAKKPLDEIAAEKA